MTLVVVGLFFSCRFPPLAFQFLESRKVQPLGEHLSALSMLFAKKPKTNKTKQKNLKRRLGLKETCVRCGPDSWSLPLTGTRIPTPALTGLLCGLEQASLPNSEPQFPHL